MSEAARVPRSGESSGIDPTKMSPKLIEVLQCPLDGNSISFGGANLKCAAGHEIRMERGVPIFAETPRREASPSNMEPLRENDQRKIVDAFVDDWIVNTNGNLYWQVRGKLSRYPIPSWPGPAAGNGERLIDIGCSWGRWSLAAAAAGFQPIGLDVHLDALWAAKRVARELKSVAEFVCCDAEELPFRRASIDFVFSYSVLQHLEKSKVTRVFKEAARILKPGGTFMLQLPNAIGLMSVLRQAQRGFRAPAADTFEMRYWRRTEIAKTLAVAGFGGSQICADGFMLQNTQIHDLDLLSAKGRMAVRFSDTATRASRKLPLLARIADSFWVVTQRA